MQMRKVAVMLALSGAMAYAAGYPAGGDQKLSGWISDSKCAAAHMGTGQACVKKCIAGGEKPVFVDDATKKVWTIDDPASVKDHYGHHVEVTASVNDSSKSIHIAKLTMMKDQGSSAGQSGMDEMH
jgi:hypothetical protein